MALLRTSFPQSRVATRIEREVFERLYASLNRREFVHPDPLELLYGYPRLCDREVVGLIVACLAYGRVGQILKSASAVLAKMGCSPFEFVMRAPRRALRQRLSGFRHRFTTGDELVALIVGIRRVVEQFGSLQDCFVAGLGSADETVAGALAFFTSELAAGASGSTNTLLPSPGRGSACKRLNLFLRWMVRNDEVDPGGWERVAASRLIVPLDTHMHRIGLALGLTSRRSPTLRAALEITESFKRIAPNDPVRYDFALTRLAMTGGAALDDFLGDRKLSGQLAYA